MSGVPMNRVVEQVRQARQTRDGKKLADIFDWSLAKPAQAEVKLL